MINSHAEQLKISAEEGGQHATDVVKQFAEDFNNKAQGYFVNRRSASPEAVKAPAPVEKQEPEPEPAVKTSDFPEAPKDEPVAQSIEQNTEQSQPEKQPLLAV